MRWSATMLVVLLLYPTPMRADDRVLDWVKVTDKAAWQARDSSGEVVYKNKLWLLGGWFDSFSAPPRDVWSSPDGASWTLATKEAPWKHSDLPMTLTFDGRMWLIGGWYNGRLAGHGASGEVWSSTDGVNWTLVTNKPGWSPRIAAGAVVFKGRMWILGGTENYYFGDATSLKNDVWSSADGADWKRETANAPWSPRAYHVAVVHDDKLWVIGGGNYVPNYSASNDVWSSPDGVHWQQVTDHAPWSPRIWFSAVVHRERMWILGGWSGNPARNWGDVWHARDGRQWTELRSNVVWKPRHEHSPFVFQDKIWVAGGHAQPLSNEVWSLEIPKNWFEEPRETRARIGNPPSQRPEGRLAGATASAPALEPIPEKLVVLTFDDSSKSHVTVAAPLLKKYGFGATFFVTEGFDFPANKRDYMTWDEIAQLHRDGFEIGNHTRDHKAPSAGDPNGTIEQLEAINARCLAHGIPRTVSFAYPGNVLDRDVLPVLQRLGIKFARRGGSPEYPYDKGRGFAYEPGLDHPLLIPSSGDGRPSWALDDFKRAVSQAKAGRIAVIQLHGVPDTAHAWVNTPTALFESYLKYLAENGYRVVALRDLARYVDSSLVPSNPWGVIEDRKALLASGRDGSNARPARTDSELRGWLISMLLHHRYTATEAGTALDMTAEQVNSAAKRLGIMNEFPRLRHPGVLPYPGGRHPRAGFLDGAIRPQRETKVSLFAPWADGGYAVADVPEAVWYDTGAGSRKLLYLAHTHVPTVWDEQGVALPPLEWAATADGSFEMSRTLPNKVTLTSRVTPGRDGTWMEFRVTNNSSEIVKGLDVQMCVMLKGLAGFGLQSNDNKVFQPPFASAHDRSGRRWVITAWQGCKRAWGNPPCPCVHADPRVPDCPPGESRRVKGWVSYYEGTDLQTELKRLEQTVFGGG